MSLTRQTTEKDSRPGSRLSARTDGAMEKEWPNRPSDRQLQDSKTGSGRAAAPVVEAVHVPAHAWWHQAPRRPSS